MNNLKKTALATALTAAMGISTTASADIVNMTFNGQFSLDNNGLQVNPDSSDPAAIPGVGSQRTPVSGFGIFNTSMTSSVTTVFDANNDGTATPITLGPGAGAAFINSFSFFGSGAATASAVSFQALGSIDPVTGMPAGPGTIVAGQMGFNWNGNFAIPVTAIFDAAGFFGAIPTLAANPGVPTPVTGGALSTTPNAGLGSPAVIGNVPMAMTNWNTAGTTLGSLFPLVDDGTAGSPMTTAPFPGFNADFDFTTMTATLTPVSAVPVPAAVWLFGSGLMGLVGVARRRRS